MSVTVTEWNFVQVSFTCLRNSIQWQWHTYSLLDTTQSISKATFTTPDTVAVLWTDELTELYQLTAFIEVELPEHTTLKFFAYTPYHQPSLVVKYFNLQNPWPTFKQDYCIGTATVMPWNHGWPYEMKGCVFGSQSGHLFPMITGKMFIPFCLCYQEV